MRCPVCNNPLGEFRDGEHKRCANCDNTLKEEYGTLRVLTDKEIFFAQRRPDPTE